jgi:hypothetical protein
MVEIKFVNDKNQPLEVAIKEYLFEVVNRLEKESGKVMQTTLLELTKKHVGKRYPNSKHYNTNKIVNGYLNKNSGAIDVKIAGICRAYHFHLIKPKKAKWLTIPVNKKSEKLSARQFNWRYRTNKLFKPKGKNVLAVADKSSPNGITVMYALSKKAYQKRDKTLLPTDHQYYSYLTDRLKEFLNK